MKHVKLSKIQWVLVCIVLLFSMIGAWRITDAGDPDGCPDEWARQLVTDFIYRNNKLPLGRESEIIIGNYGFSYALRPYLTAIIGALFMKIISIFRTTPHALLFASRLCSMISVTVLAYFSCKLGNRLFRKKASSTLFATVICLLPQVMYLGMYQNNDIFALMSIVLVLYFLVSGQKEHWKTKYCIGEAVGFSLGLLSYYSIYGWILLCGFCLLYYLLSDSSLSQRKKWQKIGIIATIVLCLAGWFFIRNAILHNGDFLGISTEEAWRKELEEQGVSVFQYSTPSQQKGASFSKFIADRDYGWLRTTQRSFIGVFGYMTIYLGLELYYFYYIAFGIGILFYLAVTIRKKKAKEDRLFPAFPVEL